VAANQIAAERRRDRDLEANQSSQASATAASFRLPTPRAVVAAPAAVADRTVRDSQPGPSERQPD